MTMDFVGNIDRAAPVLGNGDFALGCRLQVPNGVLELWVVEQFLGGEGRHGLWPARAKQCTGDRTVKRELHTEQDVL